MRVHELAKELGLASKELVGRLLDMGIEVKNHMSSIPAESVDQVRSALSSGGAPAAEAQAAPQAQAPEAKAEEPTTATAVAEEPPPAEAPPTPTPTPPAAAPAPPAAAASTEAASGEPKTLTVRGAVIVKDFAKQLGLRPNQLIAELMGMNIFASINERIDIKFARQLAEKHGFILEHEKKTAEHKLATRVEEVAEPEEDQPEDLLPRPPVVAFLGHVDHGKTSLLDQIRKTRVAKGEDGGITQHIGAYSAEFQDRNITFLDTPGHAAFTAMRARGANLTDIVVLIVAADDGIMPQTREAIQHARAAGVCLVVAINKIDLPRANVDRVMQQLQAEDLAPEQWGGDVVCCPVSAETGEGIDHLLEMILLQADILELTANPSRRAQGYVIEAQLEPGMGPTATLLIRRGSLSVGDTVATGTCWGRIKALINPNGIRVRSAGPSSAVKCLGLTDVPEAGAEVRAVANDRVARSTAEKRATDHKHGELTTSRRASLEAFLKNSVSDEKQELNLILKADVQGSLEAIADALTAIESEKVTVKIILSGVGSVTDNDVLLASASNAIILGFHVSQENRASSMARREGVEIRLYSVIYELLDEVRDAMTGLLEPVEREKVVGHAEIREVFDISKMGRVAGCMVVDGQARSKARARIRRGGDVMYEGRVDSLKRFQNDASEVREGQECGIGLDKFPNYQVGDIIEFYEVERVAQQL